MDTDPLYKPVKFFSITFLLTWAFWFTAAYFSYHEEGQKLYVILMFLGLLAPFAASLWMIFSSKNQKLKNLFLTKLLNWRLIHLPSILIMMFVLAVIIALSIYISALMGESFQQLQFAEQFSFSAGFAPVLLVLALAATFEELGWRSYAMDSLASRYSYFTATLIFATLWGVWHLPLFFVNNYYQKALLEQSPLFAINFMLSVFPIAFIINWLCKLNRGSILIAGSVRLSL